LIPSNDEAGFVEAFNKLFSDHDLLMKFKHKSREISLKFDLVSIIKDYEKVMEKIVNTHQIT